MEDNASQAAMLPFSGGINYRWSAGVTGVSIASTDIARIRFFHVPGDFQRANGFSADGLRALTIAPQLGFREPNSSRTAWPSLPFSVA
jgi:hypothetical protein